MPAVQSSLAPVERYDYLYSNAVQIGAGVGTPAQLDIKTQADSIFVVQTLMAMSDGRFSARFTDDGAGASWSNDLVSDPNLFGTAQRPNILIQPIIIYPTSKVVVNLYNLIAGANDVEIVLGGYKVFKTAERNNVRVDQWFQYVGTKTLLASNMDTLAIQLQADSHFEVQKMLAYSTGTFLAKISDSGLGKAWGDRAIMNVNQFGTAQYPRVLPFPKLLRPNSVVQIELTDTSIAGNDIEIVLEGIKKYSVLNG